MRLLPVLVLLCLALVEAQPTTARHRQLVKTKRYDRQRRPPPPVKSVRLQADPVTNYFTQLLDHFDPTVNATWQQRYFSNPALYAEGGPVFIFIEGESEAESGWIAEGGSYMYSMAELFKAKQYVLEHRFFGESRPTADISTANLKWLTSDQALADLAYFIEYLIQQGEVKKGQKIAVFGGSYPGNLAAWARLKYPHLIHAAVASSAPVHAEEDFPEYFEVVTQSIRRLSGDSCADNLKQGFDRIQKLLMTTDGVQKIQNLFYMCDPPNPSNKLDMDFFFDILANPFAIATQYNRDNSYSQYSLKAQCQFMEGDMTPDQAVEALSLVFVNSQGFIWDCIDFTYATNTQSLKSKYYGGGDRQWVYMTCTMFGYFQTADGDTCFPKGYFDVPFYLQQCKDAFGDNYQDAMVKKGVERTNTVFGDWTPDVDNVMFVNGDIDPWHSLSVLKDVNPTSPAVLISGTSHCYDMYANDDSDSQELLQARDKVKQFLLNVFYEGPDSENPTIVSDKRAV